MFVIFLTPKSKHIKPHKWVEGGTFSCHENKTAAKRKADIQASQTRRMKEFYDSVDVIPNSVLPK
jgi:hypothetical protein